MTIIWSRGCCYVLYCSKTQQHAIHRLPTLLQTSFKLMEIVLSQCLEYYRTVCNGEVLHTVTHYGNTKSLEALLQPLQHFSEVRGDDVLIVLCRYFVSISVNLILRLGEFQDFSMSYIPGFLSEGTCTT